MCQRDKAYFIAVSCNRDIGVVCYLLFWGNVRSDFVFFQGLCS